MAKKTKVNAENKKTSILAKKNTKNNKTLKNKTKLKINKNMVKKSIDSIKYTSCEKTIISKYQKSSNKQLFQTEYYDLPFNYNQTIIKVLAQTPKTLFVYWEISEEIINNFKQTYGENFLYETKPILIVYNDTLNYSFEIDINDFANSWYIYINDSNCNYHVELGRKPCIQTINEKISSIPDYVYITSSNEMTAPNNKILFDFNKTIPFRNIKTGQITQKDITNFSFITNFGIINIKELYNYLYPNENFFSDNCFSGASSSGSFSSQFK